MDSRRRALLAGLVLVTLSIGVPVAVHGLSTPSANTKAATTRAMERQEEEVVSSCRAGFIGDAAASSQWHTPASPRTAEVSQVKQSSTGWMVILSGGPKRLGFFCAADFQGARLLGGEYGPFPILLRDMQFRLVVDYDNTRVTEGIFDVFVRTAPRIVEVRGVGAGSKPVTARTRDGFAELEIEVQGRGRGAVRSYPSPIGELLGLSSSGRVIATCGLSDHNAACVPFDANSST
jgi:hypothetical protein